MEFLEFISQVAEMTGATRTEDPEVGEVVLALDTPGGRGQEVRACEFTEDGRAYVRFYTSIGRQGEVPRPLLLTALELNASLAHGAFALYEGRVALVDTLDLAYANSEEGARILSYLGRMADTFEKMAYGVDRS